MTKAAMCTTCGQIIGPRPRQEDWATWTWCADPCAHSAVRWRDGYEGLLEVTSLHGPEGVVVLGLHNQFLGALAGITNDEAWRRHHERVTDAPGYLFDKSKRACWAVVTRVGQSNDVFFMSYGAAWSERIGVPATATDPALRAAHEDICRHGAPEGRCAACAACAACDGSCGTCPYSPNGDTHADK